MSTPPHASLAEWISREELALQSAHGLTLDPALPVKQREPVRREQRIPGIKLALLPVFSLTWPSVHLPGGFP